jgi:hypothetical protein
MVPRASATWLMPEEEANNQVPIASDHSHLVKFNSQDDTNYLAVRSKIEELIKKAPVILQQRGVLCKFADWKTKLIRC